MVTDISAWVAYFSGEKCDALELALGAGMAGVPAMVKLELLANPISSREREAMLDLLNRLPTLGLEEAHLLRAAKLKANLEQEGICISSRDAHILQCAIDQNAVLLTNDPILYQLQKSAGVRAQMW